MEQKLDLKAPRIRNKAKKVITPDFVKRLRLAHPELKKYSIQDLNRVVKLYHENVIQYVIDNEEGHRLPFRLGKIVIMSYKPPSNKGLRDLKKDGRLFLNNHTDGFYCKIVLLRSNTFNISGMGYLGYTFTPCRNFKRSVSEAYKTHFLKYKVVLNEKHKKYQTARNKALEKEYEHTKPLSETYNEFNI